MNRQELKAIARLKADLAQKFSAPTPQLITMEEMSHPPTHIARVVNIPIFYSIGEVWEAKYISFKFYKGYE